VNAVDFKEIKATEMKNILNNKAKGELMTGGSRDNKRKRKKK
jgi:hypothetical protein